MPVLTDAVRLKREHDEVAERLAKQASERGVNGHEEEESNEKSVVVKIRADIAERIRFINELGIQIKDLDIGLIDFPTMRNGVEVLLCWRMGEPAVAYWHTYEGGYPGRRPI